MLKHFTRFEIMILIKTLFFVLRFNFSKTEFVFELIGAGGWLISDYYLLDYFFDYRDRTGVGLAEGKYSENFKKN